MVRTAKMVAVLFAILTVVSCTSSYTVTPLVKVKSQIPASETIEVVYQKPDKPFLEIATFIGSERKKCGKGHELCDLRARARKNGANTIWVQKKEIRHYPGDWVEYDGRLVRIYPYSRTVLKGVFITY